MDSKNSESLRLRLESIDTVPSEPLPAGWSRRNWVQREALALAVALSEEKEENEK